GGSARGVLEPLPPQRGLSGGHQPGIGRPQLPPPEPPPPLREPRRGGPAVSDAGPRPGPAAPADRIGPAVYAGAVLPQPGPWRSPLVRRPDRQLLSGAVVLCDALRRHGRR